MLQLQLSASVSTLGRVRSRFVGLDDFLHQTMAGNILLPFSPGALDGLEYALAAALAALGVLLYGFRDRTLSDEAREALIFGGPERR